MMSTQAAVDKDNHLRTLLPAAVVSSSLRPSSQTTATAVKHVRHAVKAARRESGLRFMSQAQVQGEYAKIPTLPIYL
jgi:hypothetical protein